MYVGEKELLAVIAILLLCLVVANKGARNVLCVIGTAAAIYHYWPLIAKGLVKALPIWLGTVGILAIAALGVKCFNLWGNSQSAASRFWPHGYRRHRPGTVTDSRLIPISEGRA